MSTRNEDDPVDLKKTNLRSNLQEYQKTKRLPNGSKITDRYIAYCLGPLLDGKTDDRSIEGRIRRYKNIKYNESKRFVSMEMVRQLAFIFRCSAQELITGEKQHNGKNLTAPIYDIAQERWAELAVALDNNPEFVEYLHFLFCELPKEDSKVIIKSLSTYLKLLMERSFYSTSVSAMKRRSDLMAKLIESDKFYSETNIILLKASDYLHDGDRSKALATYLSILVHYPSKSSEVLINKEAALTQIEFLKEQWKEFPTNVGKIVELLSSFFISPDESTIESQKYKKVKKDIENYINATIN